MRLHDNRNWNAYPLEYADQIRELREEYDLLVYAFTYDDNNDLVFRDNLHTNWMDLYNTIYKLGPKTIYEVGCGSGQHLANMQKILPDTVVSGCDINSEQTKFGRDVLKIDAKIYDNVKTLDFAWTTVPKTLGQTYDVVYSQAVLMHLSHSNALACLKNMLKISNKHVILIENPDDHDYNSMLNTLHETEGFNFKVTYPAMHGSNLYSIEKI